MATSAMLWGGAAYNNGILPFKRYILGEAYTREGIGATLVNPVKPDATSSPQQGHPAVPHRAAGVGDDPAGGRLPRLRARRARDLVASSRRSACPTTRARCSGSTSPGRPDIKQSNRGPGTGSRIAVPVINITKTRLNDPHLWFLGTNDQPGDYRSSGCTACHAVYANDRDPKHSGVYAKYGHAGETATKDPTIPKDEPGHPIRHEFTRAIPSSQCMVCHMHQPNVFVNTYYGTIMWDYESDAPLMWPEKQKYPTARRGAEDPRPQPRGGGDPRQVERPGVPEERLEPEPEAQGHAVRRLPRPRLELPRRVQARPQGHAPRQGRQARRRRRPGRSSRRRCTSPRSTSTWASTASTATSRRTCTATATSTARWRRPSRSTAATATAPRTSTRRCAPPARPRARAAWTCRSCARRTGASASSGATASSSSARRSTRTSSGRCRW